MNIKLVAMDLDGTLLDDHCTASKRNMDAVRKVISKGIHMVPTTGRCRCNIKETIFQDVEGIQYCITANGSVVARMDSDEIIHTEAMPVEIAAKAYELAERYPSYIEVYADADAYVDERGIKNLYQTGVDWSYCDQLVGTNIKVEKLGERIRSGEIAVNKYHIVCLSPPEAESLKKEIAAIEDLHPISVFDQNIEVVYKTWSKRDGLKLLTSQLGIKAEEVLAIGDSNNDYEMLQWAGHSIAMGNAADRLKNIVDDVVSDNNHDGLAEALERVLDL